MIREWIWRQLCTPPGVAELSQQREEFMTALDDALARLEGAIGSGVSQLCEAKAEAQAVIDNDATENAAQAATRGQATADKIRGVADALEAGTGGTRPGDETVTTEEPTAWNELCWTIHPHGWGSSAVKAHSFFRTKEARSPSGGGAFFIVRTTAGDGRSWRPRTRGPSCCHRSACRRKERP